MSCCVSKLDLCRLVQESYKSPTFNFGDTDVTNDTFVYKVKIAGESFTEYPCTVIAPNIVVIDEYTLPVGNYIHEMLWTSANGTELIFQGGLKITSVGSCCGSNRNNTIKVIRNETVVRINVTESNIIIGGGGGADLMINTTHADLLDLVNNSELVPGQQYRITDYVATVTSEFTEYAESANHPFDIIVTADSTNKLNENARAIRHEGDTYFPSTTNFQKWELKYSIYNDNNRFEWADTINGRGVIYELQDDYDNIMPFDFKGIKLYNYVNSSYQYTFGESTDDSLNSECFENKQISTGYYFKSLPLIFLGSGCYRNTFNPNSQNIRIGNNCIDNNILGSEHTIGNDCSNLYINSREVNIGNGNVFHEINSITTIGDYAPCIFKVYIGADVGSDLIDKLSNFTTPPNGNVVEVMFSASGNIVMQQRVSATTTESFDV